MVDGVRWKRNGVPTPSASQKDVTKDAFDKELVMDSVKTLVKVLHTRTRRLQAELTIIKAIMYKHHNQHRKEKYFQGLKKVVKCVTKLEEFGIYKKMAEVKDKFPKLSKHGTLVEETMSRCPSVEMVVNFLGDLTLAADLVSQAMSFSIETFQHCYRQLALGFFLTFHLTCVASVSRIWIFLKVCLTDFVKCYEVMFPWLQVLGGGLQMRENSNAKDLPNSLKRLFEPVTGQNTEMCNRISLLATPSTNVSTPGFLDKLFAPTTKEKPKGVTIDCKTELQDHIKRLVKDKAHEKDEAIPLTVPVCDLEESIIDDEPNAVIKTAVHLTDTDRCKPEQPLPSCLPITDDWRAFKRKLFAGVSMNSLQEDARNCTKKMKQEAAAIKRPLFVVCKKTTCKHRERDFRRLHNRGYKRFVRSSPCNVIHVFSDRRWKSYKEALQKQKSCKRGNDNAKAAHNTFRQLFPLPEHKEVKIDSDIKEQSALNKMNGKITILKNSICAPNQDLGGLRSSRTNKFCGLEGNFCLSKGKRSATKGNNFIQHHMSPLSKTSCPKESTQERTEQPPFEDEIDSIFSLLDD